MTAQTEQSSGQMEFSFPEAGEPVCLDGDTEKTGQANTLLEPAVRSVYGSPILMGMDMRDYDHKSFEEVVHWSPSSLYKEELADGQIDLLCFKSWAWTYLLAPLTDPEGAERVMGLNEEQASEFLKGLPPHHLASFVGSCSPEAKREALSVRWHAATTILGVHLATRLGQIRLGRKPAPKNKKWVGKKAGPNAPKVCLESKADLPAEIGQEFLSFFVGPHCADTEWRAGYRGCMWRLSVGYGNGRETTYVEEFEEEDN